MTDILKKLATLTAKDERGILPCPSCSQKAYLREEKKWSCQLHGDPHQSMAAYCNNPHCHARPKIVAGDIFNGGREKAKDEVIKAWNYRPRESALIALVKEAAAEIERIRKAAQNVIDTFKIGDDIVKDGVPKYVANAIATTALHELNRALNPQEPAT